MFEKHGIASSKRELMVMMPREIAKVNDNTKSANSVPMDQYQSRYLQN